MFDCHLHILPGIDDGAESIEESIELARQCAAAGVTHLIATPHGNVDNIQEVVFQRDKLIADLQKVLVNEQIPLQIYPGMELLAGEGVLGKALNIPECRCGLPGRQGNPLLLELPMNMDLAIAGDLFFEARMRKIPVILAHPERYENFTGSLPRMEQWMDSGLYLQFNSCDFERHLFLNAHSNAMLRLVKHAPQCVLLGSDAHHPIFRPAGLETACQVIRRKCGEEIWRIVSDENPAKLFGISPATNG